VELASFSPNASVKSVIGVTVWVWKEKSAQSSHSLYSLSEFQWISVFFTVFILIRWESSFWCTSADNSSVCEKIVFLFQLHLVIFMKLFKLDQSFVSSSGVSPKSVAGYIVSSIFISLFDWHEQHFFFNFDTFSGFDVKFRDGL
jgi:hypothetical protein